MTEQRMRTAMTSAATSAPATASCQVRPVSRRPSAARVMAVTHTAT